MSLGYSYTDFHFDLSGSSAWLYVHSGAKIFYFVEPTDSNLNLYQRESKDSNRIFFPGLVHNGCRQVTVSTVQLLVIPGGWIHGVYTQEDTIAVGGNFLHSGAIQMQIKCQRLELQSEDVTSDDFLFPHFRDLHSKFLDLPTPNPTNEQQKQDAACITSFLKDFPLVKKKKRDSKGDH